MNEAAAAMMTPELFLAHDTLNALDTHIAVVDATGVILFVNDAWMEFARNGGADPAAHGFVGTSYLAVCEAAVRQGDVTAGDTMAGIEDVLRGRRRRFVLEYPCSTPDREQWFRMTVTPVGTEPGRIVVAHDEITAQATATRALDVTERRLEAVLDALPVGVWILDADGRIVRGNTAGLRIWGGARYVGPGEYGQYRGWWRHSGEAIAAEEWAAARAIRSGETSIGEEIEIECFDGTRKIILNSAVPLFDDAGRCTGAIVVNQDITVRARNAAQREQLLREQARLRLEAVQATHDRDEFIAMLSHELRNAVQSVLGWTAVLKRGLRDDDALERAAAAIERSAQMQARLLEETFDLSRAAFGQLTLEHARVDLPALVAEMVEGARPAAAEKRVILEARAEGGAAFVRGDPLRLRQVLWNLLSNALKFTPAGGHVDVRTDVEGGRVRVSVHDSGMGIPAESLPHLFDRFRRGAGRHVGRQPGLGLGLAIAKDIVELHGGTLNADSAGEGHGATFTLRLPIVKW